MSNFESKVLELNDLKKSKKCLESKLSRIKQSLEFTLFCNRQKKLKAITKVKNKIEVIDIKINKLNSDL